MSEGIREEGKHADGDLDRAPAEGKQVPRKDAQCAELQVRTSAVKVKQVSAHSGYPVS